MVSNWCVPAQGTVTTLTANTMTKTYHHMIPFVINYQPPEKLSDAL